MSLCSFQVDVSLSEVLRIVYLSIVSAKLIRGLVCLCGSVHLYWASGWSIVFIGGFFTGDNKIENKYIKTKAGRKTSVAHCTIA